LEKEQLWVEDTHFPWMMYPSFVFHLLYDTPKTNKGAYKRKRISIVIGVTVFNPMLKLIQMIANEEL
jgi:hypothetical protein